MPTSNPASDAWAAKQTYLWELQTELIESGLLRCNGPIEWGLERRYKPTIPPVAVEPISIAFPEPCVVKDNVIPQPRTNSPRVACAPILSLIEEESGGPSLDMAHSILSANTIWSQESAEFSCSGIPVHVLKSVEECFEDPAPSIIIGECSKVSASSPEPTSKMHEHYHDFLQTPAPGVERPRPILGSVNRSNFTGDQFKLSAPPRKHGFTISYTRKLGCTEENASPTSHF